MYLTATRPNLMFVVSLISRYMEQPTETHLQAAKRVLRYIKGTVSFGLFYKKGGTKVLVRYIDNDYVGDQNDINNTSSYVFVLSDSVVSWSSKKQPIVTLSTTKVEFIVVASSVC